MGIKVVLFANYREIVGSTEVMIDNSPGTTKEVIDELVNQFPGLIPLLYHDGELKHYVNILVNGVSVRSTGGLSTPVADGDEIKLFPPVSGG